jgi:2-polyprenyl-6-methoxyphenol hydroxylase-like FAD-dependent oxidoreductase
MRTDIRDADVVGDGPAALVVAMELVKRGWNIKLICAPKSECRTTRVDVLAGSALARLARLGFAFEDLSRVAQPCHGTWARWGSGPAYSFDYLASPYGHSWAIDRNAFDRLLRKRAVDAGVRLSGEKDGLLVCRSGSYSSRCRQLRSHRWRIFAAGRMKISGERCAARHYDDRLIAVVGKGKLRNTGDAIDSRLIIEADAAGWSYGIAGPSDQVCFGVITDAQALSGFRPEVFAMNMFHRTERISQVLGKLSEPPALRATPVPCRWFSMRVDANSVRVGDAQASFDPIAGKGLWEAIRSAHEVAVALDTDPEQICQIERVSAESYQRYMVKRSYFYQEGFNRYGTDFWSRRLPSDLAGAQRYQLTQERSGPITTGH